MPMFCFADAVPIDTAASQLMVSFPMIPELMDINSWLRGNGRWSVNHSVELSLAQIHILF